MTRSRSFRPWRLLLIPLRLLWGALVVVLPVLGVWVGSSLATYLNGPTWLACLVGLVLFPAAPLGWEAWAQARKRRRPGYEPVLTRWDRLVLRTLAINLAFLGALLLTRPQAGFTALSSRGDWMLEGRTGSQAQAVRRGLFAAADRLQWLYEWSADNAYEDLVDDDDGAVAVDPEVDPSSSDWKDPWTKVARELERAKVGQLPDEVEPSAATEPLADKPWPRPAEVELLVANMPEDARGSVESVGRYLAENASDPYVRVKAIHDFVATHVVYDIEALNEGRYPDQSAGAVFESGRGVCAGYANLVKALGKITGDEIVVVVGVTRKQGGDISGNGHAWNAARIDGRWHLIDATWDAGNVTDKGTFVQVYGTGYLFVPPEIMGATHFPDKAAWQLRPDPLSRGEFVRQPMMRPAFFSQGFSLPGGTRSQVTVDEVFEIDLGNSQGFYVMAFATTDDGTRVDCQVQRAVETDISCKLPRKGKYSVRLFSSPRQYGRYEYVGELHVNARG